jgi:hypothetical protein
MDARQRLRQHPLTCRLTPQRSRRGFDVPSSVSRLGAGGAVYSWSLRRWWQWRRCRGATGSRCRAGHHKRARCVSIPGSTAAQLLALGHNLNGCGSDSDSECCPGRPGHFKRHNLRHVVRHGLDFQGWRASGDWRHNRLAGCWNAELGNLIFDTGRDVRPAHRWKCPSDQRGAQSNRRIPLRCTVRGL